jgi:NCS1 family nucleobase:cation symporter-1
MDLPSPAAATYSPLTPVPDAQRVFTQRDAFALWFSLGIGLLVAQAGALLVPGLSLPMACAAIGTGTVLGVVLLAGAGVIGADTGLAAMSSLRVTLGSRGALLPAAINAVQLIGWGAFEIIVMRDSAQALSEQTFGYSNPLLWTLLFGMLATALAVLGPLSLVRRVLRNWGVWLLWIGAAWLTYSLLAHHDLAELWHRPGDGSMSFGAGVDLVIAMPLSWLPLIADYTRFGRRPGQMFRGTVLGYGIANLWFYLLGATYALVAGGGEALLTTALASAGGGLALLLVLTDEIDNAFADIHSAAVSAGLLVHRMKVGTLSLCFGAACTLLALSVPADHYQNFLLLIGSVFAPLFGVVLTDHFVVRGRIGPPVSRDRRWQMPALTAWLIGIAAYHAIAHWLPELGSTLPSLLISALCYHLLAMLHAQPQYD